MKPGTIVQNIARGGLGIVTPETMTGPGGGQYIYVLWEDAPESAPAKLTRPELVAAVDPVFGTDGWEERFDSLHSRLASLA